MASRSSAKSPWLLFILSLLGLVAGSLLSQLLRPSLPFLTKAVTVGFEPGRPLALGDIFSFMLGFRLRLDMASLLGLIVGIWVYTRI